MNKGIVMEKLGRHIIVMTPDGQFKKVSSPHYSCQIGDEIKFRIPTFTWKTPSFSTMSAFVAALIFGFIMFTVLSGFIEDQQVVAYVSMDINPSVEMGIDAKQRVRVLKGLNSDGEKLVQSVDYKGKGLQDVVNELLTKADPTYLTNNHGDIVINSTFVKDQPKEKSMEINTKLKEQVIGYIKKKHPTYAMNYSVDSYTTPTSLRKEARKVGISSGKYALYLNANASGTKISLNEFKKYTVIQLAKKYGSFNKLVHDGGLLKEEDWAKLLASDLAGKFGRQIQTNKKPFTKKTKNQKNNKADQVKMDKKTSDDRTNNKTGIPNEDRAKSADQKSLNKNEQENQKNVNNNINQVLNQKKKKIEEEKQRYIKEQLVKKQNIENRKKELEKKQESEKKLKEIKNNAQQNQEHHPAFNEELKKKFNEWIKKREEWAKKLQDLRNSKKNNNNKKHNNNNNSNGDSNNNDNNSNNDD